jgi:hypothetical protein
MPNLAMTGSRTDARAAAEGNVVVSPVNGSVTGAFIGEGRGAFMGTSTLLNGMTLDATGHVNETTLRTSSDPVLTYTLDGRLWMIYIAYNFDTMGNPTGMRIRVTSSTDDGHTWAAPVAIEPTTTCASGCDKPWIAAGPAPGAGPDGGVGENLYAGFLQQGRAAANLMVMRSEDHGATWSLPQVYASIENVGGAQIVPNLQTLVVGPDGTLHATYAGLNGASMTPNFGDPSNRIAYRSSHDGGRTWSPPRRVSATSDSVVYNQPFLSLDGTSIYIVYTSGTPVGAWDVMLATSTDGGLTWSHRKVNDEPDSCATHAFPNVVADRTHHVAHVMWQENRFGEGDTAYASCPQDSSMPCARNEAISDHTYTFTTGRDPSTWHGDYNGMTISPMGTVWAYWSDTRTGTPQMYLSAGMP